MTFSASRLTLYALISAIEEDLRGLVSLHLSPGRVPADLLSEELIKKATDRHAKDTDLKGTNLSLDECAKYLDYQDLVSLLSTHASFLPTQIFKALKPLIPTLLKLTPIRNRVAHSRPLDYDDLASTLEVSDQLSTSKDISWPTLQDTILQLKKDPSSVLGLEIAEWESETNSTQHNLPLPDFDETGFLGRSRLVADVITLIRGPYPVISIVGEGGIGKSALALKVAYELLDQEGDSFDAIIWSSAKTAQLTPQEIVRIESAISSSLGMLQHIAGQFTTKGATDPVSEILEYLRSFRILLILDNLETVLDDRIRTFLERLPQGSKVLITSRIGLGAFEYPVKLHPMDHSESSQLLRALARIRGIPQLAKRSADEIKGYCVRLKNNPGFIKWFVSAVQSGKRPEDALAHPALFLEFCLQHVYEYLTPSSKRVLHALLGVLGQRSQAELAFMISMDIKELQQAIQQLLTTNMITMASTTVGSSRHTTYELSELARAYLAEHQPVPPNLLKELQSRKKQLSAARDELKALKTQNPYSILHINVRSPSDLIVAKYLKDALFHSKRRDFAQAEESITKAKDLAPEYYEVHRVDGFIKAVRGNISGAKAAYEVANELEGQDSRLKLFYGGFLMRYLDDLEGALPILLEGERIDPSAPEILLELARLYLYQRDFPEGRKRLDTLLSRGDLSYLIKKKVYDLHLQYYTRKAEDLLSQHNAIGAMTMLEQLKEQYTACPSELFDAEMREKVRKAVPVAMSLGTRLSTSEQKNRQVELVKWLQTEADRDTPGLRKNILIDRSEGTIVRIPEGRDFGFIKSREGKDYYFHRLAMRHQVFWSKAEIGDEVSFAIGMNSQGPCAQDVILIRAKGG